MRSALLRRARRRSSGGTAVNTLPAAPLLWLMAGFALLLLPQWGLLPWWLTVACVLLAGWRWLAQQGTVRLPGRWLRLLVMAALTAAYVISVRGQFTVDSAASFFVLAVGLKWLETRSGRDFFVLFFILTYLAAVNFLFRQGIGWALVNLAGVVVLLVALQLLHGSGGLGRGAGAALQRLGMMTLKTLPIVVLLFVFFPRLEPLWSVPLVSQQARTGISDTMTPGDISNLAQNRERAFRVSFGGAVPEHRDRYWRGLILDRFDGATWRQWQSDPPGRPARVDLDGGAEELRPGEYDVLMEASGQRWVYGLESSVGLSGNLRAAPGGLFRLQRPADTSVRYRMALVESAGLTELDPLDRDSRRRYLQLPDSGNPRAYEFAGQLRAEHGDDLALVQALLDRFRTEPYFYTLRPPAMPGDSVDALLFDEMRGFCAHYASATAFVLRAAGIPARVVVGYQGGRFGAGDNYLIVRQYDAHAWVEAWVGDQGWVRVDPTAAIAPARIESGLQDAMAEEGSFLEGAWASPERYQNIAAIQWLSLQMDRVNYNWQRWIVGYQGQTQTDLFRRLPGNIGLRELGYISAGLVGVALLIAGIWATLAHGRRGSGDPVARLIAQWQRMLRREGLPVPAGITPSGLAELTAEACPPVAARARTFAARLNSHYYGAHNDGGAHGHGGVRKNREPRLSSQFRELRRAFRPAHGNTDEPAP